MLWWGRSDPVYPRNAVIRRCLEDSGYRLLDFWPKFSKAGDLEAALRRVSKVDLVWVPCFRHRDLLAARRWSTRHGVPLVFDPLISAFDKQIYERSKHAEGSPAARRLRDWERQLFRASDLLIADTHAHAEFFCELSGMSADRVRVVPVSADENLFVPCGPPPKDPESLSVLFFGSFIPLQGPEVIVEAANRYQGPDANWLMIGDGPLKPACRSRARESAPLRFEDWLPYTDLPARIAQAHVVLGIFGATPKANRVVPNKVCQGLASGRPMVTRKSAAFPPALMSRDDSGVLWTPPEDPDALAEAVASLAAEPRRLEARGHQARSTYAEFFSSDAVAASLKGALEALALDQAVSRPGQSALPP